MSEQIWEAQNVKIIYIPANEHGCMRQFKMLGFAFPAVFCYFMPFSSKLISESRAKMLRGNNPLNNRHCHSIVLAVNWIHVLIIVKTLPAEFSFIAQYK